jgi:transposase
VKQVAEALDVSESTARRMADELEKEWGEDVVRRSPGGQRQIYLPLLLIIRKED